MLCILGTTADAQRNREFGACVCAVEHRELVCRIFGADSRGMPRGLRQESRLSEERESAGFDRFARVEFSVQQFDFAGFVRRGSVRARCFRFFRNGCPDRGSALATPFFNKVNIPLGLLLLFLTGVGPLLAWRKTSTESLKRNFAWPLIIQCWSLVRFCLRWDCASFIR